MIEVDLRSDINKGSNISPGQSMPWKEQVFLMFCTLRVCPNRTETRVETNVPSMRPTCAATHLLQDWQTEETSGRTEMQEKIELH